MVGDGRGCDTALSFSRPGECLDGPELFPRNRATGCEKLLKSGRRVSRGGGGKSGVSALDFWLALCSLKLIRWWKANFHVSVGGFIAARPARLLITQASTLQVPQAFAK